MRVLYLVFNEGYSGDVDLAAEAIRLTRQLAALVDVPEVDGLLALMLLHHARRRSRTRPDGRIVPLAEQDRTQWDTELIAEGIAILQAALARDQLGEYQAQAAIAALHADAPQFEETDWVQIVEWYDELLRFADTPIVRLNRAVAVGEADGALAGLAALAEVDEHIPRRDAVAAYLHEKNGDLELAARLYADAARNAPNLAERDHQTRQAARLNQLLRHAAMTRPVPRKRARVRWRRPSAGSLDGTTVRRGEPGRDTHEGTSDAQRGNDHGRGVDHLRVSAARVAIDSRGEPAEHGRFDLVERRRGDLTQRDRTGDGRDRLAGRVDIEGTARMRSRNWMSRSTTASRLIGPLPEAVIELGSGEELQYEIVVERSADIRLRDQVSLELVGISGADIGIELADSTSATVERCRGGEAGRRGRGHSTAAHHRLGRRVGDRRTSIGRVRWQRAHRQHSKRRGARLPLPSSSTSPRCSKPMVPTAQSSSTSALRLETELGRARTQLSCDRRPDRCCPPHP